MTTAMQTQGQWRQRLLHSICEGSNCGVDPESAVIARFARDGMGNPTESMIDAGRICRVPNESGSS